MARSRKNLVGQKFNRWTVISFDKISNNNTYWICKCECGTQKSVEQYSLTHGKSKSCGCLNLEKLRGRFIDLTGQKIGKWSVICKAENNGKKIYWHCRCECGTERDVAAGNLLNRESLSCGCTRNENTSIANSTHGLSQTRLYQCYHSMMARCYDIKNQSYIRYGAKGITVCPEWQGKNGFTNFAEWALSHGYADNLTLDRYPNQKGNYEPKNCRWATPKQQANNFSRNVLITKDGETHTMREWCDKLGLNYYMVASRYENGWDEDKLLIPPTRKAWNRKE